MIAIFITSIRDLSFDFKLSFENLSMQFRLKRVFYIFMELPLSTEALQQEGFIQSPRELKGELGKRF